MKIKISRFYNNLQDIQEYEFKLAITHPRLLDVLTHIKTKQDPTLTFKSGCKSGVCGSCAVLVNGAEKLACKCIIQEDDFIEPLKNLVCIKDLVVDLDNGLEKLKHSNPKISQKSNFTITKKDEKRIEKQSECILCNSCYSACPILPANPAFLGPYTLTNVFKYIEDKKEANPKDKLDFIQSHGIWDCTLCGACTLACPQGIDPKNDILQLRNISVMHGYKDPNLSTFGGFNMDFGFNPNGF